MTEHLLVWYSFSLKWFGWRVVKSGEECTTTLHLPHPQCLSGFQPVWWKVKSKSESRIFTSKSPLIIGREGWSNRSDSPEVFFLPTYRFLPGNGTKLPWQGAISCHNQAINDRSLLSTCQNHHDDLSLTSWHIVSNDSSYALIRKITE